MHPWVKVIQVFANEGPNPFPRGDDYEISKIHRQNFKNPLLQNGCLISTKLGTMHPWMKGIQVCSNEPLNDHKVNNGFFLLLFNVMI